MKVLITGSTLESLYFCNKFINLEVGSVTLWSDLNPLQIFEKNKELPFYNLDQEYWYGLVTKLSKNIFYRNEPISRIQKTYLNSQDLAGKRIQDTFKVVYQKSDEKNTIETFENYDLVVDVNNIFELSNYIGGSAPCVQEEKFYNDERIFHGIEAFNFESLGKKVGVIGNSELVKTFLSKVSPEHLVLINVDNAQKYYETYKGIYEQEIKNFEEMRLQGTRLTEPTLKCEVFKNVQATNIDILDDKDQVFLTLERPSFLGEELLQTIALDQLFVLSEFDQKSELKSYLNSDEPGFFPIFTLPNIEELDKKWSNIESEINQLFRKIS